MDEIGPSALRLTVTGEVDMATADQLDQALHAVLRERRPRVLVVDLAEVPFLDCAGVAVLVRNHRYAEHGITAMTLTGARPIVHRILRMLNLLDLLQPCPAQALACC